MNPLSAEENKRLRRIADEPSYWIRTVLNDFDSSSHDSFFDLVDRLKATWSDIKATRVDICFALDMISPNPSATAQTIQDGAALQKIQLDSGSRLIFVTNLSGQIIDRLNTDDEIEPVSVKEISRLREIVVFWLGSEFNIYCKGYEWTPKNKNAVLREIKSKKRRSLLSMSDYNHVLKTHFENFVRDESRVKYWFKKNELLQPSPEAIFQQCLWSFIDTEVECIEAEREPMFKDQSRCDIKITTENYDIYFIEIKWIGKSAIRKRNTGNIDGSTPHEFDVGRAIDGAFQTKTYIDKHNAPDYDNRIKLGIYLVYDAYNPPKTPVDYGKEIQDCVLLRPVEFSLYSVSPSTATKNISAKKGLIK